MSTGGTFQLVTNDGRMDTILTASNLLRDNIVNIKNARRQRGETDTNPTLVDLERSHVLFVNAHFKPYVAISLEYYKISANNVTLGTNVQVSIPQYGDFFADMVLHVNIKPPTTSFTGTRAQNSDVVLYKHCDYPGERLLQQTSFEVNSNPLDAYSYDTYVLHRQFKVSCDKLAGWRRCMGQESPDVAEFTPSLTQTTDAPITARTKAEIFDGYQTYKTSHDALNLWIPLLFWFNTDPRLAFPSVSVPYGQRFINFQLAKASDIYRAIINPASTTALTAPVLSTPQVNTFDLYINNLFVLPEVHAIFIDRIAFTLIRVHRRQTQTLNLDKGNIHLVQIKWPVEVFWIGFQPDANIRSNTNVTARANSDSIVDPNMEDWHRYGAVTNAYAPNGSAQNSVRGYNGSAETAPYILKSERPHITTLRLTAHGVNLFNEFPAEFFNSYIPYQYGGSNINTPTDPGLYMISFSLYPGVYQPSGHFNASRARELYLEYQSTLIGKNGATGTVFVNAQCINFILITEGSATIRYST